MEERDEDLNPTSEEGLGVTNPADCMGETGKQATGQCHQPGSSQGNTSQHGGRTWAGLFNRNRVLTADLGLKHKPIEGEIVFGSHDLPKVEEVWGFALLMYVFGSFPGQGAVQAMCKQWSPKARVQFHHTGWIVCRLESSELVDKVISGGPYSCMGRACLVKKMPEYFQLDSDLIMSIPVWASLPGLPLQCWGTEPLSLIASKIGVPLCMDAITKEKRNISYARVLVEVDLNQKPITEIPINLPNGIRRIQPVHYEIQPILCSLCNKLGHCAEECGKDGKQGPRGRSVKRRGVSKNLRNLSRGTVREEKNLRGKSVGAGKVSGDKSEWVQKNRFEALQTLVEGQGEEGGGQELLDKGKGIVRESEEAKEEVRIEGISEGRKEGKDGGKEGRELEPSCSLFTGESSCSPCLNPEPESIISGDVEEISGTPSRTSKSPAKSKTSSPKPARISKSPIRTKTGSKTVRQPIRGSGPVLRRKAPK